MKLLLHVGKHQRDDFPTRDHDDVIRAICREPFWLTESEDLTESPLGRVALDRTTKAARRHHSEAVDTSVVGQRQNGHVAAGDTPSTFLHGDKFRPRAEPHVPAEGR